MGDQAIKAGIDGVTTAIISLATQIAALVAAQQGTENQDEGDSRSRSDDEVIHEIDLRLDRARQKERYFLALEDEELDEADRYDRRVQVYKSVRDLNRAARERVFRQRHRKEAQFFADQTDHYTAKIQRLEARRSVVFERAEEERRAQFEVLLQNNKIITEKERHGKDLHRVEPIEGTYSDSNGGDFIAVKSVNQDLQILNGSFKGEKISNNFLSVVEDSASEETILESGLVASKISAWRGLIVYMEKKILHQMVLKERVYSN